jgi:hypothetical protein
MMFKRAEKPKVMLMSIRAMDIGTKIPAALKSMIALWPLPEKVTTPPTTAENSALSSTLHSGYISGNF